MHPTRRSIKRQATASISYRERSSSDFSDLENVAVLPKRTRLSKKTPSSVTSAQEGSVTLGAKPVQEASIPLDVSSPKSSKKIATKSEVKASTTNGQIASDDVIPHWASLPYEILLDVLRYASYPLLDGNRQPSVAVAWLLKAAYVCKAFAAPALAALYECPPFLSLEKPHQLLSLLREDDEHHFINYRTKVKHLELDSRLTLAYSATGRGLFDISTLIPLLPQLSTINITNSHDRPPFRRLNYKGNWTYPPGLFHALKESNSRLRTWRWHGEMITDAIGELKDIHCQPFFQNIRNLYLSHLVLLSDGEIPTRRQKGAIPTDILASLNQLSSLSLESCQSESWHVFNQLPNLLTQLSVVNCSTFDVETLLPYLKESGRALIRLTLNHNRSLNLAFLPELRACCPYLEFLHMDMTYYSASVLGGMGHQSDADPQFDCLLQPGDIPTWPSRLQELSLLNMRKWSSAAATSFFESLITFAPQLPHLRCVSIKAMLDIGWRERAGFREKWIGNLSEALLRKSQPPSSHLVSKKAFRQWKEKFTSPTDQPQTHVATRGKTAHAKRGGMCELVEISIDNNRPNEARFREEDFIDSEVSGDEDWTGDNELVPPRRYAW